MPIVLNGSGPVTGVTSLNTTVSDTEIGYLDGVTSAIQSQINTAGGLVKITDATFSAQSSVSVNNCFTTTYDNYKIMLRAIHSSTATDLQFRLRASGSDNSTANYNLNTLNGSGATISGSNTFNQTSTVFARISANDVGVSSADVFDPALAKRTVFLNQLNLDNNSRFHLGEINIASAFDGFTIFVGSGTFTGNLRVYGYRN